MSGTPSDPAPVTSPAYNLVRQPFCGGILAGLPTATLQANLAAAQKAYSEFMAGGKIVEASYTQGDGARSVRYSAANIGNLTQYILQLQRALGIGPGRRAIRPFFR